MTSQHAASERGPMASNPHVVSLAAAFTREHHQIDTAIEDFLSSNEPLPQRATHLVAGIQALRRHIYLEEEIVFPHLPSGELMMPLMVMYREHGQLWAHMDALEQSLHRSTADTVDLAATCREMLALLERHNSKEEPIIYPYMDTALTDDEQHQVRDLLADGTLPDGWVCREASPTV